MQMKFVYDRNEGIQNGDYEHMILWYKQLHDSTSCFKIILYLVLQR